MVEEYTYENMIIILAALLVYVVWGTDANPFSSQEQQQVQQMQDFRQKMLEE